MPPGHFLRVIRREDLEEDLFSYQVKIKGKLAEFAYFYEVKESGYEINPDEIIVHTSTDGESDWYAAVSRATGQVYGLSGFPDATEGLNRLAKDASLQLGSEAEAERYTGFIWRVALGIDHGSVVGDLHDLKHRAEDVFYSYRQTANYKFSFEQWWNRYEKSQAVHRFGVHSRELSGAYDIDCVSLRIDEAKIPVLQETTFRLSENGLIGFLGVKDLYPEKLKQH